MKWFTSMLKDGTDGSVSSKRVITLIAFLVVCVSYVYDQFTIHTASKELFDAMIYLVIAGLGFTASEKFAPKKNQDNHPNE